MKFQLLSSTLTLLFFSSAAVAGVLPRGADPHELVDWSQHQFQAPTETDARGPCPGLNTLANHGFLPHDGKNITIKMVLKAGLEGFNVHRDLLLLAAKAGVMASPSDDEFSLSDISLHGNIEHDASVSRVDRDLGNNVPFNEEIFTTLANSNPGVDYYNATSAGQVQKARLEHSKANNPNLHNTIKEILIRTRESALYLLVMGDPATGKAPKDYVNIFFREERLPLEEGWRVPKVAIDDTTESPVFRGVFQASEWEANPEQYPWLTLAPGATEDPLRDGTIL
ncbi:hypothetical protein PM082_023605 [Marasmius tenuissimus]|nr:hypothetical protein PM082_023605 [Marasmius tenuissimus]